MSDIQRPLVTDHINCYSCRCIRTGPNQGVCEKQSGRYQISIVGNI